MKVKLVLENKIICEKKYVFKMQKIVFEIRTSQFPFLQG